MVAIKMTRNSNGSPDGYTVKHYVADEEYDVPESLAKLFVESDKVAEYVTEEVDAEEVARIAAEKEAARAAKAEAAAIAKAEKEAAAAKAKAEKEAAKALKAAPENKVQTVARNKKRA